MSDWAYKSHRDLVDGGYRLCDHTHCPICGAAILIYQIVGHMPVFLDAGTYAPHFAPPVHADPLAPAPISGKDAAAGEKQ
jgi:hypothetical protein